MAPFINELGPKELDEGLLEELGHVLPIAFAKHCKILAPNFLVVHAEHQAHLWAHLTLDGDLA